MTDVLTQSVPYPAALDWLVKHCSYRPRWVVMLYHNYDRGQGSVGTTLIITTATVNSHDHRQPTRVDHLFPVPPAAFDERSWRRWLFECFHQVELHECMEFFEIDGSKPYSPDHKPGRDPYAVVERGTWEDADISFRGERNHPQASPSSQSDSFRGKVNP